MKMNSCYRFEKVAGENPLFLHVDATYVVHLETNGRLEQVRKGLRDYFPSKNTFILFNKGYKNCKKNLPKQTSAYDIVDANLAIFRDAREKNYRNILILEDDFFFHKDIRNHAPQVDAFILKKQDEEIFYFLGCIPGVVFPYDWNHYRVLLGVATHAVIYSKNYRDELLNTAQSEIDDWDMFQMRFKPLHRYMYFKPLCYQLFPETENSKMWGKDNIFLFLFAKVVIQLFRFLNLHKEAEPGYSIFYFLSRAVIILGVLIIALFTPGFTKKISQYI
uniref:Glycosyltransferase n=1 Tax=viral metagenome TaxID=1070528 RepID=A0A6C0HIS7_9ZZZZ